ELAIPRDPRAPAIARATLRAVLAAHELGELADRAELLVSELATNSVRYANGAAVVRLCWAHPVLRASVMDGSAELPRPLEPNVDADRGRGLLMLDLMADRWGGCALDQALFGEGGKTIWFELALRVGPPPSPPVLAA
ncbi:ATP-binding protein, partial [Streptomyces sp. E11-3]|uniref:ATP-binding protein n=1 Tax=Streptomyces sp. E11-3 TaxID=3110112 RepID=UPI00397FCCBD